MTLNKLRPRRLAVEILEHREMMAVGPSAAVNAGDPASTLIDARSWEAAVVAANTDGPIATLKAGGVLCISGTQRDDYIDIMRNGINPREVIVHVNGLSTKHVASRISRILVLGFAGHDDIRNRTNIPSELHGGPGRDTLVGGKGNDSLFGDAGADKLYGKAGDDLLDGGKGDDYLEGGAGRDRFSGGDGFDEYHDADQFDVHHPFVGGAGYDDVKQGLSDTCVINAVMGAMAKQNPKHFESAIREVYSDPTATSYSVALPGAAVKSQNVPFDGTWTDGDSQPLTDAEGYLIGDFWNVLVQRAFLQGYGVAWWANPDTWDDPRPSTNEKVPWQLTMYAIMDLTGSPMAIPISSRMFDLDYMHWLLNTEKSFIIAEMPSAGGADIGHAVAVMGVDKVKKTVTLWNPVGTPGKNGRNNELITISFRQFKSDFEMIWFPMHRTPYPGSS